MCTELEKYNHQRLVWVLARVRVLYSLKLTKKIKFEFTM